MKHVITAIGLTVLAASATCAQDITWSGNIKGIVEKQCLGCHGADSAAEYPLFKKEKEKWIAKGQAMRMDSYSHLVAFVGWPNSGAMMRRLDDGKSSKDGKPGNMYQHLGSSEEERQQNLGLFKAWIGNWSLKRWAEMTKEDLNGIKVKY